MMVRNSNNGDCTLYFYGRDKYGHNNRIPILFGNTRVIDEYIAYCHNYTMLFQFLPDAAKDIIKNNFCDKIDISSNESLSGHFKIFSASNTGELKCIFKSDEDVLYCEFNDIVRISRELIMSESEYNTSRIKSKESSVDLIKYNFFKKLYYTYVKGANITKTLELDCDDEKAIHSVATSFENIKIIIYNAWQKTHDKRNLSWMLKDTLTSLNSVDGNFSKTLVFPDELKIRFDKRSLDITKIKKEIIDNVLSFWGSYVKENEISSDDYKLSDLNIRISERKKTLDNRTLSKEERNKIEDEIFYLQSQINEIKYRDILRDKVTGYSDDDETYRDRVIEELMDLSEPTSKGLKGI